MDGLSILVGIGALIAYFATKKQYPFLLWLSGLGLGVFGGLLYANMVVQGLLR